MKENARLEGMGVPIVLEFVVGERGVKGERGEKGEVGPQGPQGPQGEEGETPVKGIDYYTDKEKQDFSNALNQRFEEEKAERNVLYQQAEENRDAQFAEAEAGRDAMVEGKVKDVTRLQGEVAKKANIDGYYSSMAVGAAENLIGQNVTTQYFTFQPSGNTLDVQDGLAVVKNIKGNTVVVNQISLPQQIATNINNGIKIQSNTDGSYNVVVVDSYLTSNTNISSSREFSAANHILYVNPNFSKETGAKLVVRGPNNIDFSTPIIYQTNADGWQFSLYINKSNFNGEDFTFKPICIDLTRMFGSGNEPATVEELERLFPNLSNEYNKGSLLNLNADSIKSVDAEGVKESVVELPIKQYFSDGMKAVGNVRDEIVWIEEEEKYKVIKRIGIRDYQTGDEEVADLRTDKTNTCYILESPMESFIDCELIKYKVWNEGTEEIVADEPTTPIIIEVAYGVNAVDTLNRLPQNYISVESMRGFLAQLGSAMGGSWTMMYDEVNNKWVFSFEANAVVTNEE